jgi:hypothetical protein
MWNFPNNRNSRTIVVPWRTMAWSLTLLMITAPGCRERAAGRVDVAGKVTFQGKPVPKGRIDFVPDRARGNHGPAGYAVIDAGRFDTRQAGRGAVPGPQTAVIQGFDGRPGEVPGMLNGNPLFETYRVATDLGADHQEYDFEVPQGTR